MMNLSGSGDSHLKEGNIANVIKGTGRNLTTQQLRMLFNPVLMAKHQEAEESTRKVEKPVNVEVNPRDQTSHQAQEKQLNTNRSFSYNVQSLTSFSINPKSNKKKEKKLFVKFDPSTEYEAN